MTSSHHLNCQADARKFTARCDFCQRLMGLTGVGGNHKLHLLKTTGTELALSHRPELHQQLSTLHREFLQLLINFRRHSLGSLLTNSR